MVDETEKTFKTGITAEQLSIEAQASLDIQAKRQRYDPHMQLQVNRAGEKGDVESLSQDDQTQLFNPDGTHSAQVVQQRVINYQTEHKRVAMPVGQERPQKRAAGVDALGEHRMPGDGEILDQQGQIIMVNPQYAEESAAKMRAVSEADAKNLLARSDALNTLCLTLSSRPDDPVGAIYCNFEESRAYIRIYQDQAADGIGDSYVDFLPMRQYVHKFRMVNGKMSPRPFLPNEVGVFQKGRAAGKILCLNDKDLANTNLTVQVPLGVPVTHKSPISSSPGTSPSGFQVRSSVPVQVRQEPSVSPPVVQPTLPVVQPTTTRMTPVVPSQGHQTGAMKPAMKPVGKILPPPPKGFK